MAVFEIVVGIPLSLLRDTKAIAQFLNSNSALSRMTTALYNREIESANNPTQTTFIRIIYTSFSLQ